MLSLTAMKNKEFHKSLNKKCCIYDVQHFFITESASYAIFVYFLRSSRS